MHYVISQSMPTLTTPIDVKRNIMKQISPYIRNGNRYVYDIVKEANKCIKICITYQITIVANRIHEIQLLISKRTLKSTNRLLTVL